jgi:hypothetical protein
MVREVLYLKTYVDGVNDPSFHDIKLIDYEHTRPRMGAPTITAELMYSEDLDGEWSGKEYVEIRGEKYYIRDVQECEKTNEDTRYKYTLEFESERQQLAKRYFMDVIPGDTVETLTRNKPCSNDSTFSFYGNIREVADRLNCALLCCGLGDSILKTKTYLTTDDEVVGDGYAVMVDEYGDYDLDEVFNFEWEDKYIWGALSETFNTSEIPFEFQAKKIVFGAKPRVVDHVFKYGDDDALLSLTHTPSDDAAINRISFRGSSDNIPYYYPNKTEYGHVQIKYGENNQGLKEGSLTIRNYSQLFAAVAMLKELTLFKEQRVNHRLGSAGIRQFDNVNGVYLTKDIRTKWINVPQIYSTLSSNQLYFVIDLDITEDSDVVVENIQGGVWNSGEPQPTMYNVITTLVGGWAIIDKQTLDVISWQYITDDDLIDGTLRLGQLSAGDHKLAIYLNIPKPTSDTQTQTFKIQSVTVSNGIQETNYKYKTADGDTFLTGSLGLVANVEYNDDMIGDTIQWQSVQQLAYQEKLMPPKYRQTGGAERFYNAYNSDDYYGENSDDYLDPDLADEDNPKGKPYVFSRVYSDDTAYEYIIDYDDLKPTIEGVLNADGVEMGTIVDIAFDDNDNDISTSSDEDSDSESYLHPYFYIRIPIFNGDFGFNLFDCSIQSDTMTVQMISGPCNGCKFSVKGIEVEDETGLNTYKNPVQVDASGNIVAGDYSQKVVSTNPMDSQQDTSTKSVWICLEKDTDTFGVIMPNAANNYKPQVGDKFNITGILLPDAYIEAAEYRGMQDMMRYMYDNNGQKFTPSMTLSRIFFAEHPDILASIDEYSKIHVNYKGRILEQYVSQLTIKCSASEPLPEIEIELENDLATADSFTQSVAERAASLVANAYTLGGALTTGSGTSTAISDKRYLNKQKADRTPYKLSSDIGFEVGEFASGASGAICYKDPDTGQTYLEVDVMKARLKAIFEKLEIESVDTIKGKFIVSNGGSVTANIVEEVRDDSDNLTGWKCFYKANDGEQAITCSFQVGDQVICKEFNISEGQYEGISNRYYWRRVTEVNAESGYIVLSATDCDSKGTDAPQTGDTLCQLGSNGTDKARQCAIVISTVDENSPSITLYQNITDYTLDGKEMIGYGYDPLRQCAYFRNYGDFFTGNSDSYIQYDSVEKVVKIKAKIEATSTIGEQNQTIQDYIKAQVDTIDTVVIEYSSVGGTDDANWHTKYVDGDMYMRQSTDGGKTWSDPILMVGSDGSSYKPNNLILGTNQGLTNWVANVPTNVSENNLLLIEESTQIDGVNGVHLQPQISEMQWFILENKGVQFSLLKTSTKYTLSFDVISDIDHTGSIMIAKSTQGDRLTDVAKYTVKAGVRQRIVVTLTTTDSFSAYDGSQKLLVILPTEGYDMKNFYFANVKLEEGEIENPMWAPAASEMIGKDGVNGQYTYFQWQIGGESEAPTGDWSDTPVNAQAGEYVWMRSATVVPPSTTPTFSTPWRVTGDKGTAGSDVYFMDLDNENIAIACESDGTALSPTTKQTVTPRIFRGTAKTTDGFSFSTETSGFTKLGITQNVLTGEVAFTNADVTSDNASVTIVAKNSTLGLTLSTTLTVYKVKRGLQGDDAVIYFLQPSTDQIILSSMGTWTPDKVSCSVYKSVGTGAPALSSDHTLIMQRVGIDDGFIVVTRDYDFGWNAACTAIIFALVEGVTLDSNNKYVEKYETLYDRERIPILSDASDFADAAENLALSTDTQANITPEYGANTYVNAYKVEGVVTGDKFTLSFDYNIDELTFGSDSGKVWIVIYVPDASADNWQTIVALEKGVFHVSKTFTLTPTDVYDFYEAYIQVHFAYCTGGQMTLSSVMLNRGSIEWPWNRARHDLRYLTEAMQEQTTTSGGLILTSMVSCGKNNIINGTTVEQETYSGINGIYEDGNTPAFWAGGAMTDAANSTDKHTGATFMVRMDGSMYAAGNTVRAGANLLEVGDYLHLDQDGMQMIIDNSSRLAIGNRQIPSTVTVEDVFKASYNIEPTAKMDCKIYQIASAGGSEWHFVFDDFTMTQMVDGKYEQGATLYYKGQVEIKNNVPWYSAITSDDTVILPEVIVYVWYGNTQSTMVGKVRYQWRQANNQAWICPIEFRHTLNKGTDKNYYIQVMFKNPQVKGTLAYTAEEPALQAPVEVQITKAGNNQNILGSDGLLSAWTENGVSSLLLVKSGLFGARIGNYGLKIETDGIKLSSDGGQTWGILNLDKLKSDGYIS